MQPRDGNAPELSQFVGQRNARETLNDETSLGYTSQFKSGLHSGIVMASPIQQKIAEAEMARRSREMVNGAPLSFREFVTLVNPRYEWYWHCDLLAETLDRVLTGEINRLMIFLPPRHSKSETASRLFSAYYLYRNPDKWVGLCSYAQDLANTLSRASKANYLSAGGKMGDVAGVQHWETGKGGGFWASGVGGPITGKGFHCLSPDTPISTPDGQREIQDIVTCGLRDSQPIPVHAFNHKTNQVETKLAYKFSERFTAEPIVIIRAGVRDLEMTPEHPVWVESKNGDGAYVTADKLQLNDAVRFEDGTTGIIDSLSVSCGYPRLVYNLSVEGHENYFANGILTHNCGIIDDPVKNAEEAASEKVRANHMEWWNSTFYTRREPGAAIIVIQTRWHEMDISGWQLNEERSTSKPQHWAILNLPAIKDEVSPDFPATCRIIPDPRQMGEALCVERYPLEELRATEVHVGPQTWNALFQQRPTAQDGNLFKAQMLCKDEDGRDFYNWPEAPIVEAYLSADTATKEKNTNDYTAICLSMLCGDGYVYVVPLLLERMETPRAQKMLAMIWAVWRGKIGVPLQSFRIESNGAGASIIQNVRLLTVQRKEQKRRPSPIWTQSEWDLVRNAPPLIPSPYNSTVKKIERAQAVLPFVAGSSVRLVSLNPALTRRWLETLMGFPLAAHDDAVDAFVAALEPFIELDDGAGIASPNALLKILGKKSAGNNDDDDDENDDA